MPGPVTPPLLELVSVSKTYPGVKALDRVSLCVERGEVLALIGENGAGKSTLMKILGGVVEPSEGVIRIDGVEHASLTVAGAMAAGIAFVHQELNLFDNLDVAANVMIGREPVFGGPLKLIDRVTLQARVTPLLRRLGADFEANTPVALLSLAQRQLVEIAKALSLEARIVIMDEPTSSLTATETARLLKVIAELKAGGVAVIFISHRLNEVEHCADRVVVLRDGAVVGELTKGAIGHDAMIRMMIGRDLKSLYMPPQRPPAGAVLEITGLRTEAHAAHAIDLSLHGGEILGMAGLVGAGRTELACAVFGVDRPVGGRCAPRGPDDRHPHAARCDRPRHLPRPRGPQALRPGARIVRQREHLARQPRRLRLASAHPHRRRASQRDRAQRRARHPYGLHRHAGRHAVGRQPAESGAGEVAVDDAESRDLRRADARHRCRRRSRRSTA